MKIQYKKDQGQNQTLVKASLFLINYSMPFIAAPIAKITIARIFSTSPTVASVLFSPLLPFIHKTIPMTETNPYIVPASEAMIAKMPITMPKID